MLFLIGTAVLGVVGVSAAGLGGTPGVFAADECHLEESGRGGKSTSCSGVFVSHDGSLVDREARMAWPGGRAGAHTQVRTVLLGGYQREHGVDAVLLAVLVPVVGLLSVGCAFAGLSRATQDRLAARLPEPAFVVYVKWRS
ncbi:hypothetical protein ACFYY3_30335 [Streptomyces sp. NPDC001812]|uniref:ABC transporter permease n=1 Tax=Streptomyces cathayae TaxID=3031124 RepID=A0ABY8K313_9ACTN|nr:hypothetical protein [Streptomyces sp. HUAS 5]WGD42024.1 hypothetical protein PYS65_18675 [Streptomyces sp. HUAS 5]